VLRHRVRLFPAKVDKSHGGVRPCLSKVNLKDGNKFRALCGEIWSRNPRTSEATRPANPTMWCVAQTQDVNPTSSSKTGTAVWSS